MRVATVLLCVGTLLGSSMGGESKAPASSMVIVSGVTFPVILKKKLDVSKVKIGDEVKMELIEAVAASGANAIPSGAKLYGRIVDAAPMGQGNESRLAIVIDRLGWKHNVVPMRGVISGFGVFKRVEYEGNGSGGCVDVRAGAKPDPVIVTNQGTDTVTGRHSSQAPNTPALPNRAPGCINQAGPQSRSSSYKVEDIQIRRYIAQPSVTVLVSTKKNVVIEGGALLMVRNLEQTQAVSAELAKPH